MERLRQDFAIGIQWRAFPLHPDTPEEGLNLEALYLGMNLDPHKVKARQERAAAELGLPLGDRTMTYNSRLATELGKWAEDCGKADAFHDAVFKAYFVDGANIAHTDVLVGIAKSVGLSGPEALKILETRAFGQTVDDDWALAGRLGISAVPTFVLDGWTLVGAKPYEALVQFLTDRGVRPR